MSARKHPRECYQCPRLPGSLGFVADKVGDTSKIWVLRTAPTTAEAVVDGDKIEASRAIFSKLYLEPTGLQVQDISFSHCYRCHHSASPGGDAAHTAMNCCRQYDNRSADDLVVGGIEHANIDCWIITFDHLDTLETPAKKVFIRRAFELAKQFSDRGFRPGILMGESPSRMIWPSLFSKKVWNRESGFKSWVGHYWFGPYPFAPKGERIPRGGLVNIELVQENARKNFVRGELKRLF